MLLSMLVRALEVVFIGTSNILLFQDHLTMCFKEKVCIWWRFISYIGYHSFLVFGLFSFLHRYATFSVCGNILA
uniref:Uncharacterized protein n=1 Tax=Arundo donax TaxID=35708 RepID=A0A0A9FGE6_ARUDO